MSAPQGTVVHAYGVVPTGATTTWPAGGIDGAPVTGLEIDGLTVVIGHLDAGRYGEPAWSEHRQDPGWLEPVAREHRAVVQALIEQGDVVPLSLPAMYADEDSLRAAASSAREALDAALEEVRGHAEWSVRLFRGAVDGLGAVGSRRDSLAGEAYGALSKRATRSRLNNPKEVEHSGREQPILLNTAHLVPRSDESAFLAVAEETNTYVAAEGDLFLEVSGPLPPYSFVGDLTL